VSPSEAEKRLRESEARVADLARERDELEARVERAEHERNEFRKLYLLVPLELERLKRQLFGKKAETVDPAQVQLAFGPVLEALVRARGGGLAEANQVESELAKLRERAQAEASSQRLSNGSPPCASSVGTTRRTPLKLTRPRELRNYAVHRTGTIPHMTMCGIPGKVSNRRVASAAAPLFPVVGITPPLSYECPQCSRGALRTGSAALLRTPAPSTRQIGQGPLESQRVPQAEPL